MEVLTSLAIVVGAAAAAGLAARTLKLPALVGYLAAGVGLAMAGVGGGWWKELGQIGVTFLLFLVGLEMPLVELKKFGRTALITGLAQIGITAAAGFGLARVLGFGLAEAGLLGVALTFSSTIVAVQIFSAKRELDSLHGKLAVGSLLVQDFAAVGILIVLAGWSRGGGVAELAMVGVKGVGLVGAMLVLSETVLPRMMGWMARSVEGLYVFSVAWCLGIAAVAGSAFVGLTPEIGGLIAGLALASGAQRLEITARVRPLRDFFMVLFFVALGAGLGWMNMGRLWWPAAVLTGYVLIGNPVIMTVILTGMGYGRRTAFLAGLTMGQISEFSLVVVAAAVAANLVGGDILGVVTVVGMVSMTVCSLAMTHSGTLYRLLGKYLPVGKRERVKKGDAERAGHAVLFGHSRTGSVVRPALEKMGKKVVVVDFNPVIVDRLKEEGVDAVYGDLADAEIYDEIGLSKADTVVSTVGNEQDNLLLLHEIGGHKGKYVVVTAGDDEEAAKLYKAGADFVLVPHRVGGEYLAHVLSKK